MKIIKFFTAICIFFLFNTSSSFSLIEVDITRGNLNPLPIAVSPLSQNNESKKNLFPFYFTLANRKVFGFAGLWDQWNSPDGKAIKTCTIVTTNPNPLLKQVHDRMPVIIEKKDEKKWLGQETDIDELQALIKPYPEKLMKKSQVTEFVNSVKNNSPKCIEAQQTLF